MEAIFFISKFHMRDNFSLAYTIVIKNTTNPFEGMGGYGKKEKTKV